jgi:AraC-like DNA-binding protein
MFLTFIAFLFVVCQNTQQEKEKDPIFQKIWKLEAELKKVDASDPVKSENIIRQLIVIRDSINDPGAVVNLLSQLSEIYQYQKKDDGKALELITEMVRICAEHLGISLTSPYLFIDAGNILYNYGLYENAASVYQNTAKFALERNESFSAITALHNAGLAWQYLNQADSAKNCFDHAYQLIPNPNDLMVINNRIYLSRVALLKNRRDLVETYVSESDKVLDMFRKDNLESNKLINGNLLYNYHYINAKLGMLKGDLSVKDGNFEKGASLYRSAIGEAKKAGQNELVYNILYNYASLGLKQHLPEFTAIADTASRLAIELKDWQYRSDMARLWTTYYQNSGDDVQKAHWYRKMALANDSLKKIRADERIKKSLVQVNAAHLVLTVNSLILSQQNNIKTIFRQKIALGFTLLILICFVAGSGYLIYRYSHQLSTLLVNSAKSVGNTLYKPKAHIASADTLDQLAKRLEEMMQNQKKYFDPELSLKQLAFLLNTNPTYLSQVINQKFNRSFSDFINELRVQEACRLIETGEFHLHTLEAIGNEVGFKSKSVFFTSFKKFAGMSPSAYRTTFFEHQYPS